MLANGPKDDRGIDRTQGALSELPRTVLAGSRGQGARGMEAQATYSLWQPPQTLDAAEKE